MTRGFWLIVGRLVRAPAHGFRLAKTEELVGLKTHAFSLEARSAVSGYRQDLQSLAQIEQDLAHSDLHLKVSRKVAIDLAHVRMQELLAAREEELARRTSADGRQAQGKQ